MRTFSINEERLHEVADLLLGAWEEKSFPYSLSSTQRPQDLELNQELGKLDKETQSLFWFYSCLYMTGAISSNMAIGRLWKIFKESPECFDPRYMMSLEGTQLSRFSDYLGSYIQYVPDLKAEQWVKNSHYLSTYFDGDPRNIFTDRTYEEAEPIIINKKNNAYGDFPGFIGFQKKMAGMLTYFLIERKLINLSSYVAAVDFHLLRVMIMTGIIEVSAPDEPFRYDWVMEVGQEVLRIKAGHNTQMMTDLADALWLLSGNLCSESPYNMTPDLTNDRLKRRNKSRIKKDKAPLPIPIKHPELDLGNHEFDRKGWLQMKTKDISKSCGRCFLKNHCALAIPAFDYYQHGKFQIYPR